VMRFVQGSGVVAGALSRLPLRLSNAAASVQPARVDGQGDGQPGAVSWHHSHRWRPSASRVSRAATHGAVVIWLYAFEWGEQVLRLGGTPEINAVGPLAKVSTLSVECATVPANGATP
jgi:hypothetical protein